MGFFYSFNVLRGQGRDATLIAQRPLHRRVPARGRKALGRKLNFLIITNQSLDVTFLREPSSYPHLETRVVSASISSITVNSLMSSGPTTPCPMFGPKRGVHPQLERSCSSMPGGFKPEVHQPMTSPSPISSATQTLSTPACSPTTLCFPPRKKSPTNFEVSARSFSVSVNGLMSIFMEG